MFRVKPRDWLWYRMGISEDPAHDPTFAFAFISLPQRQALLRSLTRKVFYPHPTEPSGYIERDERDEAAFLRAIALETIQDWKNITDEEGKIVPFSKDRLTQWVEDDQAFLTWLDANLARIFIQFDDLLKDQEDAARKNSEPGPPIA